MYHLLFNLIETSQVAVIAWHGSTFIGRKYELL